MLGSLEFVAEPFQIPIIGFLIAKIDEVVIPGMAAIMFRACFIGHQYCSVLAAISRQ